MTEEHFRLCAPPFHDEIVHAALVDIHRIQVNGAIEQRVAKLLLERIGYRRVAPDCSNSHAHVPPCPLVATHSGGVAQFLAAPVEVERQSGTSRPPGSRLNEVLASEFPGNEAISASADVLLAHER